MKGIPCPWCEGSGVTGRLRLLVIPGTDRSPRPRKCLHIADGICSWCHGTKVYAVPDFYQPGEGIPWRKSS